MSRSDLMSLLDDIGQSVEQTVDGFSPSLEVEEVGRIQSIAEGIVQVTGLGNVKSEELVVLGKGVMGLVLDILPDLIGIALLESQASLKAGDEVTRSGRILDVPVGEALIGRVVDPLGRPLDELGMVNASEHWPVMRDAPEIINRSPVEKPLQTGLKVIDALIPIGCGQRELILGDRQTGKTAIALDAIINQKDKNILCVYCAIGQRSSSIAKVIHDLKFHGAMDYSIVVVVEGDDAPGLQYLAPYAATSIAEFFMARGRDVLIVYDDLTRHALAYRQLSLLLRRPPGREAFPGDIFYIHSKLLERSTHLKPESGGGSLTALPIIETEAQNMSAYIPTNLISITDGQIYLSPDLFQKGELPAVDVGQSVSRVGGKAQFPAYRKVAGDLRLSYSQFHELEAFARFGTRLDERTRQTLEHGRRVREILKQNQFSALTSAEQIVILLATVTGMLDEIPLETIGKTESAIIEMVRSRPELQKDILKAMPDDDIWDTLLTMLKEIMTEDR
ncbi:MAG: alternate F1F0 ATPase, F1 subunit alpha [Desulfobacterales bacterium]|nr:alternate F1F0 ATPase, F1 subunit alpha [Desulfobacterales bacterium]MDD4391833.1 alternate F1F0 ATPase, F1 subunit alpha [Desulfobacterales bacterium]